FSGYAGAELEVLNVQSYPAVSGNWTVEFTTVGTADLTITAVQGTTWSDSSENSSVYDLKLLELKCGDEVLSYEWVGDSVVIEDYSCNETGSEVSKVLTAGKHVLEFRFGDDVDYAYNTAVYVPDGSNVHAYWRNTGTLLPSVVTLIGTEFYTEYDNDFYDNAGANDSSRNAWNSGSDQYSAFYLNLLYNISITEDPELITSLKLTWIGYDALSEGGSFQLYFWNYSKPGYNCYPLSAETSSYCFAQWAYDTSSRSSDQTYTITYSGNMSDFIRDGRMYAGVSGDYSAATGGCAFVYSYDGEMYYPEFALTVEGMHKNLEYLSHGRLTHLEKINNTYHFAVWEQVPETQYLDTLHLLKIIHNESVEVIPETTSGLIRTVKQKILPTEVVGSDGSSYLEALSEIGDEKDWHTNLSVINVSDPPLWDTVYLKFPGQEGEESLKMVITAKGTEFQMQMWANMVTAVGGYDALNNNETIFANALGWAETYGPLYIYQKNASGEWEVVGGSLFGNEEFFHTHVIEIPKLTDGDVELMLYSLPYMYQVDQIYIDYSEDENFTVVKLEPQVVEDSVNQTHYQENITEKLKYIDEDRYVMEFGDSFHVIFEDNSSVPEGYNVTTIVEAQGYTETYPYTENISHAIIKTENMTWAEMMWNNTEVEMIPVLENSIEQELKYSLPPKLEVPSHTLYENYFEVSIEATCNQNEDCSVGEYCAAGGTCTAQKGEGGTCDFSVTENDATAQSDGVCSSGNCRDDYDSGNVDGDCDSGDQCWCITNLTSCAHNGAAYVNTADGADCSNTGASAEDAVKWLCSSGDWGVSNCAAGEYCTGGACTSCTAGVCAAYQSCRDTTSTACCDNSDECTGTNICKTNNNTCAALASGENVTYNVIMQENLSSTGDGVIIGSDDITFDCNGFALIDLSGSANGIVVDNYDNIIIKNCTFSSYWRDINIASTSNIQILDTEVAGYNLTSVTNLFINNSEGEINFSGSITEVGTNLYGDSNSDIRIEDNLIYVDSDNEPGFDVAANLILNDVGADLIPQVDDGSGWRVCTECTNVVNSGSDLQFTAPGFSSYRAGGYLLEEAAWGDNLVDALWGSMIAGDVDGDGKVDLVITGSSNSGVHFNNGSGFGAADPSYSISSLQYSSAFLADIDGDGDLDYGAFGSPNTAEFYNNTGSGFASANWFPDGGPEKASVAPGDIDNDGDVDFVLSTDGPYTKVYLFTNGAYTSSTAWGSSLENVSDSDDGDRVVLADFDVDGDLDLVLFGQRTDGLGSSYGIGHFYKNTGSTFTRDTSWEVNMSEYWAANLAVGDVDNDGDPDMAATGYSYTKSDSCAMTDTCDTSNFCDTTDFCGAGGPGFCGSGFPCPSGMNWECYYCQPSFTPCPGGTTSECYTCTVGGGGCPSGQNSDCWTCNVGGQQCSSNATCWTQTQKGFIYNNTGSALVEQQSILALFRGSAVFGDVDANGYLDLFITGENSSGVPQRALYTNDGTTFTINSSWDANILPRYRGVSSVFAHFNNGSKLDFGITGSILNTSDTCAASNEVCDTVNNTCVLGGPANACDLIFNTCSDGITFCTQDSDCSYCTNGNPMDPTGYPTCSMMYGGATGTSADCWACSVTNNLNGLNVHKIFVVIQMLLVLIILLVMWTRNLPRFTSVIILLQILCQMHLMHSLLIMLIVLWYLIGAVLMTQKQL
ncbi:FG-GAP repeat domain-containing protein, partial [Nanoarchaeota archaeon]